MSLSMASVFPSLVVVGAQTSSPVGIIRVPRRCSESIMPEFVVEIGAMHLGAMHLGAEFSGSHVLNGHHRNAGRRGQRTAM